MSERDVLVSTAVLRARRQEAREELERLKPILDRQVIAYAETLLLQWERAETDAALEFVPTARAARLTGWAADTLAGHAKAIEAGRSVPLAWRGLLCKLTPAGWTFVLASIPVKHSEREAA